MLAGVAAVSGCMGVRVKKTKPKRKGDAPHAPAKQVFVSMAPPKAKVTKPPAKTVGRQFTKKALFPPSTEFPDSRTVGIDLDDYFNLERTKTSALQTLLVAGYLASDLYGEGGDCHALDRVNRDHHEDDSPVGLAAQALWHCRQLELVGELLPQAQWKRAAMHAHAIGRLDAFRKAYTLTSGQRSEAAKLPRNGDSQRARVVDFFRGHRGQSGTLKTAVEALEVSQNGLTLEFDADTGKWTVEDENATSKTSNEYSMKSLEALWTEAGNPPQS
jgi:hypothetical protein